MLAIQKIKNILSVDTILEKGTGELNEDFCFSEDNFFGVFDGATSLNGTRFDNGVTGGYMASNLAGKRFLRNNDTLINLAQKANADIKAAMKVNDVCREKRSHLWSTSFAVARIEGDCLTWVQVGDCCIVVIYRDGTHRSLASVRNHDMETLRIWKKAGQIFYEPQLPTVKEQIRKVRERMNIDYGVLNGEDKALSFIQSGVEPLEDIAHLLLFSDGLSWPEKEPKPVLDNSTVTRLYKTGGLDYVKHLIREKENSDPACRTFPRFKPHDDIAAVAVAFE